MYIGLLHLGFIRPMSLALLHGYPSDEEEAVSSGSSSSSSSEDDEEVPEHRDDKGFPSEPLAEQQCGGSPASTLPSPADAFAEITGPPDFLLHSVVDNAAPAADKLVPPGAVLEAKPQLVVVTSPLLPAADNGNSTLPRILRPQNPSLEDAAGLLRMCIPCGVPKIMSGAKMMCPECKDRPPQEADKRNAASSKVKDREKNKRMKGQSSHATWKSESEMVLRQQFD